MSDETYTTQQAAHLLGMAVRSVQLMVDRGELDAWKTSGGHRRISRASVDRWIAARPGAKPRGAVTAPQPVTSRSGAPRVLLIEDSKHYQNLIGMLIRQRFPEVELHTADDGIAGLVLYGRLQPEVLIVDILLPGIDGATLITSLRSHSLLAEGRLIVVTSLDEDQREPYALALNDMPVVHKPSLVRELPPILGAALLQRVPAEA